MRRYNANCSLAFVRKRNGCVILVSIFRSVTGANAQRCCILLEKGDSAQMKMKLGQRYRFGMLKESPLYRLLVLLSVSMLMATICLALSPDALIESGSKFLSDNSVQYSVRRQYKLYNHCSSRQILIIGNSVTASGSQDSPNSILILQSASYKNLHGIQIIGAKSGRYLCFSRKSKLITKFSGANPRCIFEELFSPDSYYTVLRSVSNKWLVGFNRRGKPIPGSETPSAHRSRCFHFTKRDHSYLDALHKTRHYAPKISNPHKLMHLHEKRTRRQKRHTFREMRR